MKQNIKMIALATIPFLLAYAIIKGYEYWQSQRMAKKAIAAAAASAAAAAPSTDTDNG